MGTQSTDPIRSNQLMAALAAAEHLVSMSPVAPYGVSTGTADEWGYLPGSYTWRIGVHLHFDDVEGLQAFAEALKVPVASYLRKDERTLTFADSTLGEVPFRAWVLSAASECSSAVAA
ncbi:MAG TPA: hypothetical protein VIU15_39745 [Streptomyces sp.]